MNKWNISFITYPAPTLLIICLKARNNGWVKALTIALTLACFLDLMLLMICDPSGFLTGGIDFPVPEKQRNQSNSFSLYTRS